MNDRVAAIRDRWIQSDLIETNDIYYLLDTLAQRDKEVEELKKQNENLRASVESIGRHSNVIIAQRDQAGEALRKFGDHTETCEYTDGYCTCGFTAALEGQWTDADADLKGAP